MQTPDSEFTPAPQPLHEGPRPKRDDQICAGAFEGGQPQMPPRDPPIRFRKNVPDAWIALALVEGKNHQVRRMTAAVGHPTLRLVRVQIGELELGELAVGSWRELGKSERDRVFT